MRISVRRRGVLALVAIFALLFAQAVIAAHACDSLKPACHQAADGFVTCAAHCAESAPNVDTSAASAIPAGFVPAFTARIEVVAPRAVPATALDPSLAHATSPPLPILNCRLRD